jgi:nucleotide-binding universal stress UspA family protein
LKPNDGGMFGQNIVDVGGEVLGPSEHVDDIDFAWDFGQTPMDRAAENLDDIRIIHGDGHDIDADGRQVFRDVKRRLLGLGFRLDTEHCHSPCATGNLHDAFVVRHEPVQIGIAHAWSIVGPAVTHHALSAGRGVALENICIGAGKRKGLAPTSTPLALPVSRAELLQFPTAAGTPHEETVRMGKGRSMATVSKLILVPIDFEAASLRALDIAKGFASRLGGEVVIVHVYQLPVYTYPGLEPSLMPGFHAEVTSAAERAVSSLAQAEGCRAVLREGDPATEILAAADELEVSMIAMGTHGRKGLAHLILGSVVEKVLRKSNVPVLSVRAA